MTRRRDRGAPACSQARPQRRRRAVVCSNSTPVPGGEIRRRAGALHQLRQPRDVVGLDVGFEHRHDRVADRTQRLLHSRSPPDQRAGRPPPASRVRCTQTGSWRMRSRRSGTDARSIKTTAPVHRFDRMAGATPLAESRRPACARGRHAPEAAAPRHRRTRNRGRGRRDDRRPAGAASASATTSASTGVRHSHRRYAPPGTPPAAARPTPPPGRAPAASASSAADTCSTPSRSPRYSPASTDTSAT